MLQESYPRADLERLFWDLLRRYAVETRVLSRSVQLPVLVVPLREQFAQHLYETMSDIARGLAGGIDVHGVQEEPIARGVVTPGALSAAEGRSNPATDLPAGKNQQTA